MKHSRKGEIATILTLATLIVIGLSTVVSTLFLQSSKNKIASNAKAGVDRCECVGGLWNNACAEKGLEPGSECVDSPADTPISEPTSSPVQPTTVPPVPAPTTPPLPTPNAKGELLCSCSDAESCSGGHWCGNDCRIHTDNDYRCNAEYKIVTPPPPTPRGLPPGAQCRPSDYAATDGCSGFNLCGGDWKWRLNSPECRWRISAPTPKSVAPTVKPSVAPTVVPTPPVFPTMTRCGDDRECATNAFNGMTCQSDFPDQCFGSGKILCCKSSTGAAPTANPRYYPGTTDINPSTTAPTPPVPTPTVQTKLIVIDNNEQKFFMPIDFTNAQLCDYNIAEIKEKNCTSFGNKASNATTGSVTITYDDSMKDRFVCGSAKEILNDFYSSNIIINKGDTVCYSFTEILKYIK